MSQSLFKNIIGISPVPDYLQPLCYILPCLFSSSSPYINTPCSKYVQFHIHAKKAMFLHILTCKIFPLIYAFLNKIIKFLLLTILTMHPDDHSNLHELSILIIHKTLSLYSISFLCHHNHNLHKLIIKLLI